MLDNAYILSPKLSDNATLTASDSIGNADATNLQQPRPRLKWRSVSSSPWLQYDFGTAVRIDTVVLGYINATSTDTFRVRMASTQAKLTDGTAERDTTAVPVWAPGSNLAPYAQIHRRLKMTAPAPVALRWARIDFNFSSNPAGYVDMGRAMLGARIEPARSVKSGWQAGFEEAVAETVDLSGEESPRPTGTKRTLDATWHDLVEVDADALYSMLLERGSSQDVALCLDPDASKYPMQRTVVGRLKQAMTFPQTLKSGTVQHFSVACRVSELAPILMN